MSTLKDKLLKNSTIKETAILSESKIYGHKDMIPTVVPMINVALSGRIDGGLTPGLTTIAGPSKHFKTAYTLLMASAFLKQYPDGIVLFYDSEFGTPDSYISSFGIDPSKVVHSPLLNIEQFKFDVMAQLEGLDRKDKVLIMVDSIGNLASKKEVDDAIEGKSVGDMTRARSLKSVFRMVTPYLTIKDIPMIVINHTYQTQEIYSKAVVSGGTGIYYSSDNIWIVGRQQDKDGTEIKGWHFVINVEKSRFVKEKSKIPISVSYESGIMKWSGFLDIALDGQYVGKPSNGWYQRVDRETGELVGDKFREKQIINNGDFWKEVLTTTDFADYITKRYSIGTGKILDEDNVPDEE
jgi:RecA/RadA recombinase